MPQMTVPHWAIFIAIENGKIKVETSPAGASAEEVAAICASVAAQLAPPAPPAEEPAAPAA